VRAGDETGSGEPAPAPPARVRVLEDRLINQIAAGEVVERPASVLKELVENALDAGAGHLRVTLKGGGAELVEVEDDGVGMGRQDAMLCVERHATSKIAVEADLGHIHTLGFRGEALPSIAAVSRFELSTRRQADSVGTRVVIEAGRLVDVRDVGCPVGTRVTVRALFANLPARRKFLRTVQTELGHCQDALLREVLIRAGLGVELFHEGHPLIRVGATGDAAARAVALLGREADQLLQVAFEAPDVPDGMRVVGLASPPGVHRATARGSLWLYVNGRAVQDPLLRRAVLDAFRGLVPHGRFPTVILDVQLPAERVDVNVHPAKSEVRFRDGRDVARGLSEGLRQAMAEQGIRPPLLATARSHRLPLAEVDPGQPLLPGVAPDVLAEPPAAPLRTGTLPAGPPRAASSHAASSHAASPYAASPYAAPPHAALSHAASTHAALPHAASTHAAPPPAPRPVRVPLPPPERDGSLRLLGALDRRYLVCARGGDLVLVDQHAAHAAALADRLAQAPAARPLLAPILVQLSPAEHDAIGASQATLAALGLELEPFGGGTVSLRALPAELEAVAPEALVQAIGAALRQGAPVDRLRQTLADLAAVAPGQPLTPYEQRGLVEGLDPTGTGVLVLPAEELDRRLRSRKGGA